MLRRGYPSSITRFPGVRPAIPASCCSGLAVRHAYIISQGSVFERGVKSQASFDMAFDASEAPSSRVPRSIASQVNDGRSQPTKAVVYPTYDDPFELVGHTDRIVNNHSMIS